MKILGFTLQVPVVLALFIWRIAIFPFGHAFGVDLALRRLLSSSAAAAAAAARSSSSLQATRYDRCDVAVFGGGFGGLYTALALSRESNTNNSKKRSRTTRQQPLDIVLVDPGDRFIFLPLLYDLTMGTATEGEVCPTYADLLEGTGIRHIQASFDGFVSSYNGSSSSSSSSNSNSNNNNNKNNTVQWSSALLTNPRKDEYLETTTGSRDGKDNLHLSFEASVVATGATPQSILELVPGALDFAQPFYTREDAWATRDILFHMDQKVRRRRDGRPRVAVVGGGYGGVELAACLARRIPDAETVTLMTRGPPMKGTRAEPLVDQALRRLGVTVQVCSVDRLEAATMDEKGNGEETTKTGRPVRVYTSRLDDEESKDNDKVETNMKDTSEIWDAVFWTAGSGPAYPVPDKMKDLATTSAGRLRVDDTLQCSWSSESNALEGTTIKAPPVWALGDCSEIVSVTKQGPSVPRTAQAAIQQADVVAANVLCTLDGIEETAKSFQFQDLGTVLSLGGPLGAVVGPTDDSMFGPLFGTLLDTARIGLNVADQVVSLALKSSPQADKLGVAPLVENLGLSLGGYGLGVDPKLAPGTLAGTISGAARRAIYAIRMPTNRQRAYAAASAAIASASSLAKEAADQISKLEEEEA